MLAILVRPAQGTRLQTTLTTFGPCLWELFPQIGLWKVKYCKVSEGMEILCQS